MSSAKLNQKTTLVDTGANIAAATTYPGMQAYCTSTGSGFTVDVLYARNAANSAWNVVSAPVAGYVDQVSNSDGSLTISPTTGSVVASLNVAHANSWTAIQTFEASGIRLLGSSTGYTTFASANSGASNYTLTFPAATDTVAVLGTAQSWTALQTFGNNISIGGASLNVSGPVSGQVLQYDGTHWVNATVAGVLTSRVSTDQSSSNTTLVATTLSVTLAQNKNYLFYGFLDVTSSSASSIDLAINAFSNGATLLWFAANATVPGATSNVYGNIVTATATKLNAGPGSTTTAMLVQFWGFATGSTTSTDVLGIEFDNNLGSGTITVKAGSYLVAIPA